MAEYSDTTEQVFNSALASLDGNVPPALIADLAELLKTGLIHDSARVLKVIRTHTADESARRDEDR
jgi:hypothetical protein